jgi:hypothetical protein
MSRPGSIACWRFRSREAAGVIFAVKADICRGEQAMGAVGRCGREIVSRSTSRFVARCGFGIRRFDSNFSTKLCISFGSTADFSVRPTSLLEAFIYRIQRNARRPVTAAPTAKCY